MCKSEREGGGEGRGLRYRRCKQVNGCGNLTGRSSGGGGGGGRSRWVDWRNGRRRDAEGG